MTDFDALVNLFAADQPSDPDPEFADRLRQRIATFEGAPLSGPDRPRPAQTHRARQVRVQPISVQPTTVQSTRQRKHAMSQPVFIPYLAVTDARAAIEFYTEVFGASLVDGELFEMEDGRIGHASLKVGDAMLYLSDEYPEMGAVAPTTVGGSTAAIVINVDDADVTYDRAVAAGATADRPVENQHGGRSGWFRDPWGHRWSPFGPEKLDA